MEAPLLSPKPPAGWISGQPGLQGPVWPWRGCAPAHWGGAPVQGLSRVQDNARWLKRRVFCILVFLSS